MKAELKFIYDTENFDEAREVDVMRNGMGYRRVLEETCEGIRAKLEYEEISEEVRIALTEIRELIYSELRERNLSLE